MSVLTPHKIETVTVYAILEFLSFELFDSFAFDQVFMIIPILSFKFLLVILGLYQQLFYYFPQMPFLTKQMFETVF